MYLSLGIHSITWFAMLWCAIVFTAWWVKKKRATIPFMYITVWFWTEFIVNSFVFYARILRYVDHEIYDAFLGSTIWIIKGIPRDLVILFVAIHSTKRWIYSKKEVDGYGHRSSNRKAG